MLELTAEQHEALDEICRNRHVESLASFGSAVSPEALSKPNDLDVLVVFEDMNPAERVEAYFGLQEDLEALFGLSVDLVELNAIRNPYFLESVEETKQLLYAAA